MVISGQISRNNNSHVEKVNAHDDVELNSELNTIFK